MRYTSIDILRAVAVIVMIQVHFVGNLSGFTHAAPAGFGAPLFTFLLGFSYHLWLEAQRARGTSDSDIHKIGIRRGLFMFGLGLVFNVFVWLPVDTFDWDVLTLLGAGLIFLTFVRKLPDSILLGVGVWVYGISPALRVLSDYRAYWTPGHFDFDPTLSDVVLGFLVNGYFPIFPWLAFPVAGFLIARHMSPGSGSARAALNRVTVIGAGLIGVAVAMMSIRPRFPWLVQTVWRKPWTMFPASLDYVAGTLGITILIFALLHRWVDLSPRFPKDGAVARISTMFSVRALTIYILHHLVHIWPLWLYGMTRGTDPTAYWQRAMPVTWSWSLALVFLVGCHFLLRWMDRTGKPGVETLMRWLCN